MKEETAKKLLDRIMGWKKAEDVDEGYPDLQALAKFGYDDYQQFEPGIRFIESLVMWLLNFSEDERKAAYDFVKERVLYITRPQMEHIVSTAYQDFVIPELLKQTDDSIPKWKIQKLFKSDKYKILHNQTLFLGLSDGAHIDDFRRSNSSIDHEQVSRTHEINQSRAETIGSKLEDRLKKFQNNKPEKYFRNVFLLDDFSDSGISYFKEYTSDLSKIKGKIGTFVRSINNTKDPLYKLVDRNDLRVYLILYVATENAVNHIKNIGEKYFKKDCFTVIPIQIIPNDIRFDCTKDKHFASLVKNEKYGWYKIENEHMGQGSIEKPYLGFNGGGLPLILYHNTPNNSLPILWRTVREPSFQGLFPRVERHK